MVDSNKGKFNVKSRHSTQGLTSNPISLDRNFSSISIKDDSVVSPIKNITKENTKKWRECQSSINLLNNRTRIKQSLIKLVKQSSKRLGPLKENLIDLIPDKDDYGSVDSAISEDSIDLNKQDPNVDEVKMENHEFEEKLDKYYLPASDNVSGNYDVYITNCLKLITYIPGVKQMKEDIERIKNDVMKLKLDYTKGKKLLVLDMDETLIHSDLDLKYTLHDTYLHINQGGEEESVIPMNIRPFLFEFLDFCSEYFDIVIFTASCQDYADVVLNYIEKDKKYFIGRLYREHCINYNNIFLKDMSIFGRDLAEVLIVDNCLLSFAHYLKNGILVTSYYYDTEDVDLASLIEFFKGSIVNEEDIRKVVESTFEFEAITEKDLTTKRKVIKSLFLYISNNSNLYNQLVIILIIRLQYKHSY